jgi:hypothetical protein
VGVSAHGAGMVDKRQGTGLGVVLWHLLPVRPDQPQLRLVRLSCQISFTWLSSRQGTHAWADATSNGPGVDAPVIVRGRDLRLVVLRNA